MNTKMQQARDCALEMLKPSAKDLEHGLDLHRNSIVVDAYGFGPGTSEDADQLLAALNAGASPAEIQNLREDMMMTRSVTDLREQAEFKMAWDESGVTGTFRNAGEESQGALTLLKRFAHFTYVCDYLRDFTPKAVHPDDVIAAKKANRHCYILTCNGVPLTEQWKTVEEEMTYLTIFFELGCRMMHLTYNRRNMLGDGCAEPANAGLSDFGRRVIAEMNRLGIIVDVAHSGWRTSLEAARASTRPIVASHTTCHALQNCCRAKPDEVIRAIVDGGGLIGICGIPGFLGGSGTITALLDHVAYVVKTFGVDYVAIGTDTNYSPSTSEFVKRIEPRLPRKRPRFESFWPSGDPMFDPRLQQKQQRLSLDWINWPMFTVGLVQRGYADADIQKIIGGNILRVARNVLPGSQGKTIEGGKR
ncbi:MAG: membrane dipeptidase [Kiritimatiellae bacterium]|nr:membrane dipeptidase [Kiritimatiellia bacterium]